ncbi:hypothetical protein BGZ47_009274, partial [Haplosporangium gracile]
MTGQPATDNKIYIPPSSSISNPTYDTLWAIDYTVFSPDTSSSESYKIKSQN